MIKSCLQCRKEFQADRSKRKFCSVDCKHDNFRNSGLLGKSLSEVKNLSKKQNAYVTIRNHARNVMTLSTRDKACTKCGYNKHVEVAHKKPISSFSDTELIGSINSLENLVYLCPNCHWEYDNNMLSL